MVKNLPPMMLLKVRILMVISSLCCINRIVALGFFLVFGNLNAKYYLHSAYGYKLFKVG